jgi:LysR family transcriptional regulator for bpeEF and oprC
MDRILWMSTFARVVEAGSFSAVARELRTAQPNVSRHVAALERHLGTRLLHRSTRRLTPTPEGERYYGDARRVLDTLEEAEANARGKDMPRGLLRVSCPTLLGRSHVLPHLKTILNLYPEMEIDLQISDRFIDLIEEGVDLAIRIGVLKDSALKARRIGFARRICVAGNEYLAAHGVPRFPQDLRSHECIVYTLSPGAGVWQFRDRQVKVRGRLRVNSPDGVRGAVLDGLGIAYAPEWLLQDAVRDGRAVPLLLDHSAPPSPIHIVYAANRLLPARARLFTDFIAEQFARDPALNPWRAPLGAV